MPDQLFRYYSIMLQNKPLPESDNYKISSYAYGKDYHFVLKRKLKQLITFIKMQQEKLMQEHLWIRLRFLIGHGLSEAGWAG